MKLSISMHAMLRCAPDNWTKIYMIGAVSTIWALEKRGLVSVRDGAADGPLRGFEWRITEQGKSMRVANYGGALGGGRR